MNVRMTLMTVLIYAQILLEVISAIVLMDIDLLTLPP